MDFILHPYSGVTTVVGEVLGTDLSNIPKHILDQASERGTLVHEYIESYFNGEPTQLPIELWGYRDSFHEWLEQFDKVEPLHLEYKFYDDEYEIKGSVDFIGYLDGELYVIDWKTSSNMSGETLLSANLQSLIYRDMIEKHLGLNAKTRVVSIKKDSYADIPVETSDIGYKVLDLYKYRKLFVNKRKKVLYNIYQYDIMVLQGVSKKEANEYIKERWYRGDDKESFRLERL